jgi:hypothetical protein
LKQNLGNVNSNTLTSLKPQSRKNNTLLLTNTLPNPNAYQTIQLKRKEEKHFMNTDIDQVISELAKLRSIQLQQKLLESNDLQINQMTFTQPEKKSIFKKKSKTKEKIKIIKENKENLNITNTYDFKFKSKKLDLIPLSTYQYNNKQTQEIKNKILKNNNSDIRKLDSVRTKSPSHIKSVHFEDQSLYSMNRISKIKPKKSNYNSERVSKFGGEMDDTFEADFEESFFSGSRSKSINQNNLSIPMSSTNTKEKKEMSSQISRKNKSTFSTGSMFQKSKSLSIFGDKKVNCFICGEQIPTNIANTHVRLCKQQRRSKKKNKSNRKIQKIVSSEYIER